MALTEHDLKIISVRELMKEREKARKDSNFALSDKLRDRLKKEFQVDIVDQVNGPRCSCNPSLFHWLILIISLTLLLTFLLISSGWKFMDGSTRKFSSGAVVPENVQKKRKIDDTAGTSILTYYSYLYTY